MLLVSYNFYNLICKKPNLPDVYLRFLSLYNCHVCPSFLCPPIVPTNLTNLLLATFLAFIRLSVMAVRVLVLIFITLVKIKIKQQNSCCLKI
jgi:hypothetical protein